MSGKSIEQQMEETAFEPTESNLDENGMPTNPILDIDAIAASDAKYEWVDIEYRGEIQSIQVLKGNVIHFMGSLDDADLLILAEVYTPDEESEGNENETIQESVEKAKQIQFHNEFILTRFVKGVNEDNVKELPEDLQKEMLKAYDKVNQVTKTNQAVQRFPSESGDE